MKDSGRRLYRAPQIERVPLVAKEAVLSHCKCVANFSNGPLTGWYSGTYDVSCSAVGS